MEFASGPIATLVTSFDVQATRYFNIEVYGTDATLSVPNPEHVRRAGADEAQRRRSVDRHRAAAGAPCRSSAASVWPTCCGPSAADAPHRTSSALALHVLELMTGALVAAEQGRRVDLETTCERAAPLPVGLRAETFDD